MNENINNEIDAKWRTPAQLSRRWYMHVESIRRKIRRGEIASILIGRRRLVALAEIERLENNGMVNAINNGGNN